VTGNGRRVICAFAVLPRIGLTGRVAGTATASVSMAETKTQNDQICAARLQIINDPVTAQIGGYVRASIRDRCHTK
jgi:hypothetical protein